MVMKNSKLDKTLIIGINLGDFGSTGNIMRNSLEYAHEHGDFDYLVMVPKDEGKPNTCDFGNTNTFFQKLINHLFLKPWLKPDGFEDYFSTKRLIRKIKIESKKYKSTIIHLHNIHMCHIDLRILFKYLKKQKFQIFYTLHDAWPFTGGCYYYNFCGCDKWKTGCKGECLQNYSTKHFNTKKMLMLKTKFTSMLINKMTLLPVSNWLNNELNFTFLKDFRRIVVFGETSIRPLKCKDLKLQHNLGLKNKKIVLTVSSYWNEWKGKKFIYLVADKLPKDYIILAVGGTLDTKSHSNIICVGDVNHDALSHYYSLADVYMSVSQSEALGLTTCEAQICGIPVVAFGHTAIKETFIHNKTGILVGEENDIDKMVSSIVYVVEKKPFDKKNIVKQGNKFAKFSTAKCYLKLYESK